MSGTGRAGRGQGREPAGTGKAPGDHRGSGEADAAKGFAAPEAAPPEAARPDTTRPEAARSLPGARAFSASVRGRVQGVGFRYSALRKALALGLAGYVRNEPDGSVTVRAQGDPGALADFREWLDEGPPGAYIESVTASSCHPLASFTTFFVDF